MGVRSLRASSKSSVRAARPRSSGVAGSTVRSASTTSRARSSSDFRNSMLTSRPCSCCRKLFEPLAEGAEPGFVLVFAETARDLDLDLLRLLVAVGRAEHRVQYVGVEHEGLQVVADGVDVDVPVDEVDGLGAEGVPEELARAGRGLHRFVDLAQPAVVGLVRLQARVGRDRFPESREVAVVGSGYTMVPAASPSPSGTAARSVISGGRAVNRTAGAPATNADLPLVQVGRVRAVHAVALLGGPSGES